MSRFITSLVAGAALALGVGTVSASGAPQLVMKSDGRVGDYVASGTGRALYTFSLDRRGNAGNPPVLNCRATCLRIWRPYRASGRLGTGKGLSADLAGTVQLRDSSVATYNGWPLYRYIVDKGPGELAGHGMEGFDGRFRLVSPEGKPIAVK